MNEDDRWQSSEAGDGGSGELVYRVIGCMIAVHRELGPGFTEPVYRRALELELAHEGIRFESEVEVMLRYRGKPIGKQRLDFLIEDQLIVELKAVEELHKKHYAQVRSYLKAANKHVGLLANFSDFQLDPRRVELNKPK